MIVESVCPMTEYRIFVEEKPGSFNFIEESFECSLTVNHGRGQYLDMDHEMFIEDSLVITIISDDITMKHQIQTFADTYAEEFNQKCIAWTERQVQFFTREYRKV
jgi:hypothetical protein